jgi:hypothetical protein
MRVIDLILKVPMSVKFDILVEVEGKFLPLKWNLSDMSSMLIQRLVHLELTYGKTT